MRRARVSSRPEHGRDPPMPRRFPIFAIVLTFVVQAAAFCQDFISRVDDDSGGAMILAATARPEPVPRQAYAAWPAVRQVKTGRITIEFEYAYQVRTPQLHWQYVANDAYDLVAAEWSLEDATLAA